MKAKTKIKDGVIKYGKVEMTKSEAAEFENPKIRTTMFLDADLIRAYKKEAQKRGLKYQQLMRDKLRDALRRGTDVEERLKRLEEKILKRA